MLVPQGVAVRVDAEVAFAGSIDLDDLHRDGVNPRLAGRFGPSERPDVPVLELDVDARVGQITVQTEES